MQIDISFYGREINIDQIKYLIKIGKIVNKEYYMNQPRSHYTLGIQMLMHLLDDDMPDDLVNYFNDTKCMFSNVLLDDVIHLNSLKK